ncbi:hypothetical protein LINPERHAP1_LOCUS5058 [Linum perenne]
MSLNNHCEVFNRFWILEAKDMPILSCLQTIRCKMMKQFYKKRVRLTSLPHDAIFPNPSRYLRVNKGKAPFWYQVYNGDGQFEVQGERTFAVNLGQIECACGSWKLSSIPCEHTITCITYKSGKLVDYVDSAFER